MIKFLKGGLISAGIFLGVLLYVWVWGSLLGLLSPGLSFFSGLVVTFFHIGGILAIFPDE